MAGLREALRGIGGPETLLGMEEGMPEGPDTSRTGPTPASPRTAATPGTPGLARRALGAVGKVAAPIAAASAIPTSLVTPTQDYRERFPGMSEGITTAAESGVFDNLPGVGPAISVLRQFAPQHTPIIGDTAVRTAGVASDIGNALTMGAAGTQYRDKQMKADAADAALRAKMAAQSTPDFNPTIKQPMQPLDLGAAAQQPAGAFQPTALARTPGPRINYRSADAPRTAFDGIAADDLAGFRGLFVGGPQAQRQAAQIAARNRDEATNLKQGEFDLKRADLTNKGRIEQDKMRIDDTNNLRTANTAANRLAFDKNKMAYDVGKDKQERASKNTEYLHKYIDAQMGITDASKATPEDRAAANRAKERITNVVATAGKAAGLPNIDLGSVDPRLVPELTRRAMAAADDDKARASFTYWLKEVFMGYKEGMDSNDLRNYEPGKLNRGIIYDTVDSPTGTSSTRAHTRGGSIFGQQNLEKVQEVERLRQANSFYDQKTPAQKAAELKELDEYFRTGKEPKLRNNGILY